MTTTNTIDRVGGTASDISILKIDEAIVEELATEVLKTPVGARTTFNVNSGDPRYPTSIVAQVKPDPKGNGGGGIRNCLLAINTFARTETDGVIDKIRPISVVLSASIPMDAAVDVADLHDLLENLFSLTYTTVTTKEGDDNRLSNWLLFGSTRIF